MAIKKYVRVKDKTTKHEYDVREDLVDPTNHQLLNRKHYPPVSRPRDAKPFISKGGRRKPTTDTP